MGARAELRDGARGLAAGREPDELGGRTARVEPDVLAGADRVTGDRPGCAPPRALGGREPEVDGARVGARRAEPPVARAEGAFLGADAPLRALGADREGAVALDRAVEEPREGASLRAALEGEVRAVPLWAVPLRDGALRPTEPEGRVRTAVPARAAPLVGEPRRTVPVGEVRAASARTLPEPEGEERPTASAPGGEERRTVPDGEVRTVPPRVADGSEGEVRRTAPAVEDRTGSVPRRVPVEDGVEPRTVLGREPLRVVAGRVTAGADTGLEAGRAVATRVRAGAL